MFQAGFHNFLHTVFLLGPKSLHTTKNTLKSVTPAIRFTELTYNCAIDTEVQRVKTSLGGVSVRATIGLFPQSTYPVRVKDRIVENVGICYI